MGDLNYRIDTDLDILDRHLTHNKIIDLLKYDQLMVERLSGRLDINNFEEGHINFLPTYKFEFGENNYTYNNDMKHPGWTDRIM
jgi:hypothetical protein